MSELEKLGPDTLDDFLQADTAVLMLGKTTCPACAKWTEELEAFLAADSEWSDVRFGKLNLDQRGLADFKRANPWLADLEDLPYNIIYQGGERKKEFLGSGIERLTNRLKRVQEES